MTDASTTGANTPIELVDGVYSTLTERVAAARERLGRPLTLTEKILFNHLSDAGEPDSSAASATTTSPPTASPCRTPPPRWRCCSS